MYLILCYKLIAYAINNNEQVAGYSATQDGSIHATTWNGGTATDLGTLGGTYSVAAAINMTGQVAGFSYTTGDSEFHATIWSGGAVTDLGTLGGPNSAATAINNAGQVVGYSNLSDGSNRATIWNGGTASDLGTLGGSNSIAYAINNSGQVVGSSDITSNGPAHATLWNGTSILDLNSFLSLSQANAGWVLGHALSINDSGSIVGSASNTLTGQEHAFILAAVPEPETYAMLLAGLGLVGGATRRRRSSLSAGVMPCKS